MTEIQHKCSRRTCTNEAVKVLELDWIFYWEIPVCQDCFDAYRLEQELLHAISKLF